MKAITFPELTLLRACHFRRLLRRSVWIWLLVRLVLFAIWLADRMTAAGLQSFSISPIEAPFVAVVVGTLMLINARLMNEDIFFNNLGLRRSWLFVAGAAVAFGLDLVAAAVVAALLST